MVCPSCLSYTWSFMNSISTNADFKRKGTQHFSILTGPSLPIYVSSPPQGQVVPSNTGTQQSDPQNSVQHNIPWSHDTIPLFCSTPTTFLAASHSPTTGFSFIPTHDFSSCPLTCVNFGTHVLSHK